MNDLLPPLLLSLRISLSATLLVVLVAIPLAFLMSRRAFAGRSVLEAFFTLPLVLPPTVVGYFLLDLFGRRGWIGKPLDRFLDFSFQFHWSGGVLAAATVAFPLLYLPARTAFSSVPMEMEAVARLNGASLLQLFWHVSLPMARKGLTAGILLAFARALGEFGATFMLMGNIGGRETLPVLIYTESSDYGSSQRLVALAVGLLSAVSFIMVFLYNRTNRD